LRVIRGVLGAATVGSRVVMGPHSLRRLASVVRPHVHLWFVGVTTALMAASHVWPPPTLDTLSADPTDAGIFLWDFWWTRRALGHGHGLFSTDLLFYPHGTSLALHSFPLPYCLISLPVQWLWPGLAGLVAAFNTVVLLSFLLTGLGACLLATRVTGSRAAGVVAGLIMAGLPFRFVNLARLHVLSMETLIWYVLAWVAFAEAPSRGRAVLVGALLALTFESSPEYAMAAAGFSILWVAARGRLERQPFVPWPHLWLAVATCLVVASPLIWAQGRALADGSVRASRPIGEVVGWDPALLSFFTPSRVHPVYGDLLSGAGDYGTPGITGMRSETSIGLIVWALACVGLSRLKRDRSAVWALSGGTFFILTLGPVLRVTGTWLTRVPLPYLAVYWLMPPVRAMRDPTRLFPMAALSISVLAAFGVRTLLNRFTGRTRTAATVVIAGLVVFESLTVVPRRVQADSLVPPIYARIASDRTSGAVLDLRPDQLALAAQTVHGRPITAGAIAVPRSAAVGVTLQVERDFRDPDAVLTLAPADRDGRLRTDRSELALWHFRFVVLDRVHASSVALATRLGLAPVAGTSSQVWVVGAQ
jgi:hypothetical protein